MTNERLPNPENPHLDPAFENGQSEAEKLMRRHLQTPDDVVSDEELKNLKVAGPGERQPLTSAFREEDASREAEEAAANEEETPPNPWDVLED